MSDLGVASRSDRPAISAEAITSFRQLVRSEVILPADAGYDTARKVYNAMHDRRPALVVRASGVADVIAAVRFAETHGLDVAVRGGGHSVPGFGTCDDGLVIDLARMKGIRVDSKQRTVRAEGGCTWGDLNHATYAFGLATTGGVVSTTGIGGLTLGGGMGYLSRRCGLSCDNLVSADLVTADGAFVQCSESQERDLFWAIRGGGGNYGVVTSFEYRLHPIKDIWGGPIFFPVDASIVRAFADFIVKAPEELGALFGLTMAAPLPFLPEKWHGQPVSAIIACWTGKLEDGSEALAPVRTWGEVVGEFVGPMPYPVINTLFDALQPPGLFHYWKANFARTLTDGAIRAHVEHTMDVPCVESGTFLFPLDGACQRVPGDATAFAHRDATFSTVVSGAWPSATDSDRNTRWVREYYDALAPHSEVAGYINFMSLDDGERLRSNYGGNYERLASIKARYDPQNRFCVNQNIVPGVAGV